MLHTLLQIQQHTSELPDADNNGKMMVVVAVLSVIFTGIVFYLISLDRKLSKLEKENA
jgi:CcmD family protein